MNQDSVTAASVIFCHCFFSTCFCMQNQCRVEHLLSAEFWYQCDGDAAGSISYPVTFFAFTAWLHAVSWRGAAAGSPLVQRMPEPIQCSHVPTQHRTAGLVSCCPAELSALPHGAGNSFTPCYASTTAGQSVNGLSCSITLVTPGVMKVQTKSRVYVCEEVRKD